MTCHACSGSWRRSSVPCTTTIDTTKRNNNTRINTVLLPYTMRCTATNMPQREMTTMTTPSPHALVYHRAHHTRNLSQRLQSLHSHNLARIPHYLHPLHPAHAHRLDVRMRARAHQHRSLSLRVLHVLPTIVPTVSSHHPHRHTPRRHTMYANINPLNKHFVRHQHRRRPPLNDLDPTQR